MTEAHDTKAMLLARRLRHAKDDIETARRALRAAQAEHDAAVTAIHEAGFGQPVIWALADSLDPDDL